jgi:predicted DNA-binding ribbon-helix-helix protein
VPPLAAKTTGTLSWPNQPCLNQDGSRTLSNLIKRSFSLAGHRTSVALEAAFWQVLLEVAKSRGIRLAGLVAEVDAARHVSTPLASALRVLALREAQAHGIPEGASSSKSSIDLAER